MNILTRYFPWLVIALATAGLIFTMRPPRDEATGKVAGLLVVARGRFQPLDSYARTQMMLMSKYQTYTDAEGEKQPAVRWLMDTMVMGLVEFHREFQVVFIDDPEMVRFLELPPNPNNIYLVGEIAQQPMFRKELERVLKQMKEPQGEPTPMDKKFGALLTQMTTRVERAKQLTAEAQTELKKRRTEQSPIFRIDNDQLLATLRLKPRSGFRYSWAEIRTADGFEQFEQKAKAAGQRPEKTWDLVDGKTVELYRHLQTYREVERLGGALLVPPPADSSSTDWLVLNRSLAQSEVTGVNRENAEMWENLLAAYGTGRQKEFDEALVKYQQTLEERYPEEVRLARWEAFMNNMAPFSFCTYVYVVVCLLVLFSWVFWGLSLGQWSSALNRSAFWLLGYIFILHTAALVMRMYLQGRPPVTNLYSSAIFIGWGAVLLCLCLEAFFRIGVASMVGATLGFATTIISHHLATSGDTLEMMEAVLDTNFWLATHVTCVTLGYTATYVAGVFGILYVLAGVFTPMLNVKVSELMPDDGRASANRMPSFILDRTVGKTLIQMIYGVICFATLLSFVGTVLGGVWADQSWGRFWGWDPKENGALLIVAMNALILHARWAGIIRDRGVAVLAMTGNMITLWSWFGTNQLGIGLHSYGVNKTLVEVCRWGWVAQMALIGLGMTPLRRWRSYIPEGRLPKADIARAPRPRLAGPSTGITS